MPSKRRRCAPFASTSPTQGLRISEAKMSPFGESVTAQAKLTPERMAQEICDEIKRLHRRRQLRLAGEGTSANASSCSSGSEGDSSPPHQSLGHHSRTNSEKVHHRALFTFKQVRMICERMLREQEAALRAEYEAALSGKLAEQYEAFVRFNLDQIQRRPPPAHAHQLDRMDADHDGMPSHHSHHQTVMHHEAVPSYLS